MSSFVIGVLDTLTTLTTTIAALAQTTAPAGGGGATTQPAEPPGIMQIFRSPMVLPILLLLVLYIFMFRSKKAQERKKQDMLTGMKRGDRIQTIGGILGKVVEAEEDKVLVKVDENSNTKIWFSRSAIHRVITDEGAAAKEKAESK